MTTPPVSIPADDPETPPSVLSRFGITTIEQDRDSGVVVTAMPASRMLNPLTGLPSVAGLTILVDDAGGRANFFRFRQGWTVSSELTVELNAAATDSLLNFPDEPVVASAHPVGGSRTPMLATCSLRHRGELIGAGTVHTMPVGGSGSATPRMRDADPLAGRNCTLAELMAVEAMPDDDVCCLRQNADPMINNMSGIVHGGVSSAGLELVASAAFNRGQDRHLQTGSIRVNFLRPFFGGGQSRYEGNALRVGRSTAVADARAVGTDGKVAIIARVTGYR